MPFRPDSRSCFDSFDTCLSIGSEMNIAVVLLRWSSRARGLFRVDRNTSNRLNWGCSLFGLALRERKVCKEAHCDFGVQELDREIRADQNRQS
jgi:hypothetical protein